ncbi:unnamed protein product [Dibothriocephalus latus]|uniref:Vesicle tethering protein Uso1/P115-like head domain-containing protein n=1 Tax=Dibothriocephalus latus TaxID=60516 RepID=A0A3P6VCC6_DIBLA|nr:unnamed protein product [Dibothriocephalus latus]
MELFRRYLGQPDEVGEEAGADVVEVLVDRLQTSTRVEDRRDAMRGIKALSKRYRLQVGTQAMPSCIEALSRDSEDPDTVSYALDTLCNIMNDAANDVDPKDLVNIPPDLGKQFTEIFIKEPENVQLVLSFLSSYDMHLRRQTIQLLILLLENNLRSLQDILLNSPMAVSKFVDTICDPMEVIRNDGLLLLLTFTKSHSTIQKIVAFENVFQKVLNIVETETITDGGVVIEDCFALIVQLLTGNKQNQMLFKDGRFIQRLANLFQSVPDELSESCTWSAQKLVNVGCLLKVFRTLVAPTNKTQNIKACQTDMQNSGLLDSLWKVVMANGVPAELLMQTLYTMGDVVRYCPANQQALASLVAPSTPPQPAITVLLVTIVNERQQLAVRMAVLYCFQCLLASNAEIQGQVVSTLLPRAAEPHCTPAVHAFLSLKSGEETAKGAILSHLISEASAGDGDEVNVVSSLSALLIGICVRYNGGAVEGFDSKALVKIIDERMGVDDLTKRINQISRSEVFILALQSSQLKASQPSDLVFDYEFTQIFKVIECKLNILLLASSIFYLACLLVLTEAPPPPPPHN